MKIIHICPFSSGGCGVWARAKQEALEFIKKGHKVFVFSSNLDKGTNEIVPSEENLNGIQIYRFPAKKLGGESFMYWLSKNAENKILKIKPDIIIAHNYRHLHTTKALKIKKQLKKQGKECKIFLLTHAPFPEGDITRSFLQKLIVNFYDKFIGPKTLNKFDKILAISHWEVPFLIKAGAKKENIVYSPNGIPSEFFKLKKQSKKEHKIIFLGRISPKKKIETILHSIPYIKDKKLKLEIIGPIEKEYLTSLKQIIKNLKIDTRVRFTKPIYNLKEKIKKLDSGKIYILASRVEGMPQGLIEAMSRGNIVIGSNSLAIRDLIKDRKNGYLFEFNNPKDLAKKIDLALEKNKKNKEIGKNAQKFVEQFNWENIIKKVERLF